jgi:hypothetical protein
MGIPRRRCAGLRCEAVESRAHPALVSATLPISMPRVMNTQRIVVKVASKLSSA